MIEKILSNSVEDTRKFGIVLTKYLQAGDILFLQGDLGAGKSELTRGLANGLGILSPIPSPTFTILNVYEEGKLPLYHFDWYRIQDEEELFEIGADEFLLGKGISVVEWPSKSAAYSQALPYLLLTIQKINEEQRAILLESRNHFRELDLQGLYNEYTQL